MPALQVSPIVAALDHPEVSLDRETVPAVALSLVEAFAEIPDPRKARGIRHGVPAILLLGACAVLTGARSFAAIAEYAHDTGRAILDRLGVGAVVPHACTIRRVLSGSRPGRGRGRDAHLGPGPTCPDTRAGRGAGPRAAPGPGAGRQDRARRPHPHHSDAEHRGGTDAGTDAGGYRQPHLVSVLDQASGAVLGQVAVEEKGSEVAAFTTLLDDLDLTDVLITADALCRHRHNASYEDVTVMPMWRPGPLLVATSWALRSA